MEVIFGLILLRYTPDDVELRDDDLVCKATGEVLLTKPFVEKPCNAEDHNVFVYFPMSAGGGSQQIFRKTKDRSSEFDPNHFKLRTGGSYMHVDFWVHMGGGDGGGGLLPFDFCPKKNVLVSCLFGRLDCISFR